MFHFNVKIINLSLYELQRNGYKCIVSLFDGEKLVTSEGELQVNTAMYILFWTRDKPNHILMKFCAINHNYICISMLHTHKNIH